MSVEAPTLLYHGTAAAYLGGIFRDGIRPRRGSDRGVWGDGARSNPDCVYFSSRRGYPLYFSLLAAKGAPWACVEIDADRLDQERLLADEDWFCWLDQMLGNPVPPPERYHEAMLESHAFWRESLQSYGTCAHRGPVPALAICRVATFDPRQVPAFAWFWARAADQSHRSGQPPVFQPRECQAALALLFGDPYETLDLPEELRHWRVRQQVRARSEVIKP